MIVIPAQLVADASLFQSKEKDRYYLCGVLVDDAGFLVGTDGTTMFVGKMQEGEFIKSDARSNPIVSLNPSMIKACKAKVSSSGRQRWIVISDENLAQVISAPSADEASKVFNNPRFVEASQVGVFIDGTFPNWRYVVPKQSDCIVSPVLEFDASFMARFATVAGFMKGGKGGGVSIFCSAPGGPCLVRLKDRTDAFGVIMPAARPLVDDGSFLPFEVS